MLAVLCMCLWLPASAGAIDFVYCTKEECDRDPRHLEQFVEQFYIWYIISGYENQTGWKDEPVKSKLQEALSPNLYHNLQKIADETEYNPILYAQDYAAQWLHPQVNVESITKYNSKFRVTFVSPDWPMHILDVRLKVIGDKWRINEIRLIAKDDK